MRSSFGTFIIIALMLIMDFYFFQGVKTVMQPASQRAKTIVTVIYWAISFFAIAGLLIFTFGGTDFIGKKAKTYLFAIIAGLFFAKFVGVVFILVDDMRRIIQWTAAKLFFKDTLTASGTEGISRSAFLSWLSIAAGTTLFGSLWYGFGNKYRYSLKRVDLKFPELPSPFRGLKIVHISDIHSGSLLDSSAVQHGVDMILDEKPDLILFTGDLVNDKATEMDGLKHVFAKLKAPLGVYSILGNHDYGDYLQWPHEGVSKQQNLENLKKVQAEMGWRLLMNEHVLLERGGQKIALLGIENWSAKARFPRYGRMDLAYPGTENIPFKILMSHDPSHWEAQILSDYNDISLMLSGHTHGMQFGVEIPGIKWSPVQYVYKQWAGLYEKGNQKLYVNRGFGFLGYPGRVGILPEITVINLV